MNFKHLLTKYLPILLLGCFAVNSFSQRKPAISHGSIPKTDDEFVGPFSSWLNVKTGFGAKGDGIADDTRALQAALDAVATGTVNITLYLPTGTYLISSTLTINHHINVSVIGADPANTIIKWGGVAHGTMLQVNGTAYSKFDRLTWNGNRIADVAVEQSWDGNQPHFDTGNEYADDIFIDVAFGIHGGSLGHGFAETSILRDHFIRNTKAGVSLGNFNALDIWVRNSSFQDCGVGVTNTYGAGNFKVYNCVFRNSAISDMSMNNTGDFSVRGNTSINSKQFFSAANSRNPASIIIEGNTIIDPVNTQAITTGNQGPVIFINNIIRSRSLVSGTVASFSSNAFSMGNVFTVADGISAGSNSNTCNNKIVSRASLINLSAPILPGAEPNFKRRVFEVPVGAGYSVIQSVINQAAKFSGTRPVVHFPYGNYNISGTIFIPANSDIQLVGDGFGDRYASMLTWSGTTAGPIISIAGPSKTTIRDITFKGNAVSTNILITSADEKGSRIFMQEFHQVGGQTGLLVNQLDHTVIFAYDTQFSRLKKAVSVIGGPMAMQGKPADSRTIIYSGASSNNDLSNEVINGNLMVQDFWYEGSIKSTWTKLSGKSVFIGDGNHIATPQHAVLPSVMMNDFSGRATFAANDITGHFLISGKSAQTKILALGIMAENDSVLMDTSSPKADGRLLMSRIRNYSMQWLKGGSSAMPDMGTYNPQFISNMMADMVKVHPIILTALPADVSDIRLYRVMSINGAKGIDIEAGPGISSKNSRSN
ncbi:glycosyl hydrolase family 28-related protein [Mucilaginibacter sp. X5P1]|uniref:right-handed parallel beta-helix repeat-containing protein n=1 Tax=Mucilaginibacter sp. X5P1 TaxID=2723088 RepID=UPI00160B196E|nr:right-handed parallel beta-helix repeat-containing protein [Mucilaginibacter sp. X5P1]MBB6139989.1 hypothetical protein [Mucilaginibacter sp. X5P1]